MFKPIEYFLDITVYLYRAKIGLQIEYAKHRVVKAIVIILLACIFPHEQP